MKGAVGIVTGGIVMLTLVTAALIPAEAGPRAGEDLGAWITEAFSSVEEAFETTWEKAFEKSWRETFDEGIDDEVKSRFKETFRVSFEDTFKTAFEEAWGEAAEHVEHLEEHGAWNADGEFDADKTEWKDTLTFEEAADGLNALDDELPVLLTELPLPQELAGVLDAGIRRGTDEHGGRHPCGGNSRPDIRIARPRDGLLLIAASAIPTFPPSRPGSIIGVAGLNFRVRNGNGWIPCAILTETKSVDNYLTIERE